MAYTALKFCNDENSYLSYEKVLVNIEKSPSNLNCVEFGNNIYTFKF